MLCWHILGGPKESIYIDVVCHAMLPSTRNVYTEDLKMSLS